MHRVLLLTACTARQAYSGLQARERILCAEGPPQQYEECMARVAMSYEEYRDMEPRRDR